MRVKTFSVEKICDIYLSSLYKLDKKNKSPKFLVDILSRRGVFFNNEIINRTVEKLSEKDFIYLVEGECSYTYGKKKDKIIYRPWKKLLNNNAIDDFLSEDFFNRIEGKNNLYKITIKGKNFVQNNQVFDIEGKLEKKRTREIWMNRIWSFIIGVFTGIVIVLVSKLID